MASDRIQRRIERLLDQIEQEADQQSWQRVLGLAKEVLGFAPENADAKAFITVAEERLSSTSVQADQPIPARPEPTASLISPTPDQPASFADGRYQVKRFLGEGGKKKVYLAQDTLLDREVAFALIKTEGLDDTSRERIQREAQAMGRLGSHSHIVTVFDLGQERDQPYMVTELMGGGDVEGLIEHADGHRLPLEQAVRIAVETCRGLEFAHSRGIVHRDLKPGNVWLTSDPSTGTGQATAKIGDFGLAVALDRSRLTTEGMMVGTVAYMPPEQAMGGEVTPKSDLYSLGAMLYEMVTGRPPFLGDDSVAIIGQHINTPPVAPTWHNSECPRALDALILRLLAKDPSERPESASDVLAALEAIDLVADVGAQGLAPLHGEEHSLDSLAGGVFVGRQREMGELKACLEDALSGRGRMVTLVGEPGIGKTRTAQELATYAGLRGAQVLWGRSYEEQGVPPFWPWVQAIRAYVRERDPEQLRAEMGAGAADIAEVVSDVRERLPGLQPAPQLEPEQARFRLFDSIAAFLKTASQRQPLVLVLDDLHWADQPSLGLLQFVARELGGARLLIIGTYRDMELSRQHPLAETLGELTRERLFQRVLLRGLTQEDVGRFIEMTSGNTAPRGLIEAVHSQTEGNPLFVTEVVRLLAQEAELGVDPSTGSGRAGETDSWTIRIPAGVREVIGRRLNRLSQRCNEALTVASIVGREFTLAQITPLVEGVTEDRLSEILEEAMASRVIEELPQSVGRYQFTHALIQETLSGELSNTRKVRLHARIAQALEELYGADAEAHAPELAFHYGEAVTVTGPDKLVHYSVLAGERALAGYAWDEALAHFQRGLAAKGVSLSGLDPAGDTEAADLLFGLGRARAATLGRRELQEAVDAMTRSFNYYAATEDVARAVAVAEYPIRPEPGNPTGWGQVLERALTLVGEGSHEAARLLPRYGWILCQEEGEYQEFQDAFNKALAIARREGDLPLEIRTLASAAYADMYYLQWSVCLEKCLRVIEMTQRTDDPYSETIARYLAATALVNAGDAKGAHLYAETILASADRLRDRIMLSMSFWVNHIVNSVQGNWMAAREFGDRGVAASPTDPRLSFSRIGMQCELGEFDPSQADLEELSGGDAWGGAYMAGLIPMLGRITGNADRLDAPEAAAHAVLSSPATLPVVAIIAKVGLAFMAVLRHDATAAREQYTSLTPQKGTMLFPVLRAADRVLGLLAHTMGDLHLAAERFEDSLSFCRSAGLQPELAWTCCDYADMLLERDSDGDRAKAMSLLDESLAISSELGMRPLMERVLSRREILGA